MPKNPIHRLTSEEWEATPEFFGSNVAEKVWGVSRRYLMEHARELGGVRVGGKWTWSKTHTAAMFRSNSEAE